MLIKNLMIENFRSFKDKTEIQLEMVNAFVGPNKAGKSNIIKCFEVINSVSRNDWSNEFHYNIFDYDSSKRLSIQFEFLLSQKERQELVERFFPRHSPVNYQENQILNRVKYLITLGYNHVHKINYTVYSVLCKNCSYSLTINSLKKCV
jgi:AAA15 family ATPase/GTPase